MASVKKLRLGDLLVSNGVISEERLTQALADQKTSGMRLGEYLVANGIVRDSDIADTLTAQLNIPRVDLRGIRVAQDVISLIPGSTLRQYSVFPIGFDENDAGALLLAMDDPLNVSAIDDVAFITNLRVDPRVATHTEIQAALDLYFGSDEAANAAEKFAKERESEVALAAAAALEEENEVNAAPMVLLVRSLIEQAVRQRASDIHIDAMEKRLRVRYRIDGSLQEKMIYDVSLLPAITTRIKIMGSMDISEKRKPQDGRITLVVDRQEYDIRVSSLPTFYGEKLVMRLQLASGMTRRMTDLGFPEADLAKFKHILSNPNGLILVTGPTGSGKSTSLYTALSSLNRESVNLITVEDPVEASVAGINQVQVNVRANLTFANALRSILRQDPDIIMIGEIRDSETASIAVQASITGHLVLSTVHTNSSAATITRLIDMGAESFLLADALVGIIAQRLVRRLCTACREKSEATPEELEMLGVEQGEPTPLFRAKGCHLCNGTGYYGRIGVYEIMTISPAIRRAISSKAPTENIRDIAVREGMHTLTMSAADLVTQGVTTMEEMMKVSFDS